jgi:Holliday junction resolvase RusA-like endonuclease
MNKPSSRSILLFSSKINVKPLSVNQAWMGRKFKTKAYISYEKECLALLPSEPVNWDKVPIELSLTVGFSNMASDVDNVVKPFVDILQKKYNFNDKYILRLIVEKKLVKKGFEYIEFYIKRLTPRHYILEEKD